MGNCVNALIGRHPFSTLYTALEFDEAVCQCPDRAASLFYISFDIGKGPTKDCVNALIGRHPFSTQRSAQGRKAGSDHVSMP